MDAGVGFGVWVMEGWGCERCCCLVGRGAVVGLGGRCMEGGCGDQGGGWAVLMRWYGPWLSWCLQVTVVSVVRWRVSYHSLGFVGGTVVFLTLGSFLAMHG